MGNVYARFCLVPSYNMYGGWNHIGGACPANITNGHSSFFLMTEMGRADFWTCLSEMRVSLLVRQCGK